MADKILVTTPTGNIGGVVVKRLLGAGGVDVAVIARKPEKLPKDVRSRVTVYEGDQYDPDLLERAAEGASALFWLTPPDFQTADWRALIAGSGEKAAAAVRKAGIPHVVHLSSAGADRPTGFGPVSFLNLAEKALDGSGAHVLHLRPGYFYENWLTQLGPIKEQGAVYYPFSPDTVYPQIATDDIGDVAAARLLARDWSGAGNVLGLHGPAAQPTFGESARILGEAVGRPVQFVQIPVEAFQGQIRSMGASESVVSAYTELLEALDRGEQPAEPRTPETTTPTTLAAWATERLSPAASG
jgi:uncharacterized protein YbjT (DUF2867 family)